MKTSIKLMALLLSIALLLGLAACGTTETQSDEAAETTVKEETAETEPAAETETAEESEEEEYRIFRYGSDTNSVSLDPVGSMDSRSSRFMSSAVCENLWTVDRDGNITPELADYEYSEDYTSITITAKEDIYFSNGSKFEAEDILFLLNNMYESSKSLSMVSCLDLENAEIRDEYTLYIPLVNYDAAFLSYLANPQYCVIDSQTHNEEDPDYNWLVGTGPYVLTEWDEGTRYVLNRNENYRGEAPYYDEIQIYFYAEESTRYTDFLAGNLDAIYLSESSYINNLKNGAAEDAEVVQYDDCNVYGIQMAYSADSVGTLADENLRLALAHCIDVQSIIDTLGGGNYTVPGSLVGTGCWAYAEGTGAYEYDLELAKEYMAKTGYSVDNPITVMVYSQNTAFDSAVLEAIQAYAAQIGINLDLTYVADMGSIIPFLVQGIQELSLGSFSSQAGTDPEALLQQCAPNSDNVLGRVLDEDLVELYNSAAQSHDKEERADLYQQFMEIMHERCYFIPVYQQAISFAYRSEHASFADCIDASNAPDPVLLCD